MVLILPLDETLHQSRGETDRRLVGTANVWSTAAGGTPAWPADWRTERRPQHHHVLGSAEIFGKQLLGAAPATAVAYVVAGVPGSGKTTSLRPMAWLDYEGALESRDRSRHNAAGLPPGCAALDADALRVCFGEYEHGLGSGVVQAETASLTYQPLWDRLRNGGYPCLLYDTVGDPEWLPGVVRALAMNGYAVSILVASVDVDIAVDRVARRCVREGRYVSTHYVRSKAGLPEAALQRVLDDGLALRGWGVWDTTGAPVLLRAGGVFAP